MAGSPGSASSSASEALPAELLALVLDVLVEHGDAADLGYAGGASREWLEASRQAASRYLRRQPAEVLSRCYACAGEQRAPSWLSALGAVWMLERCVGRPEKVCWRDEFRRDRPGLLERLSCKFPWAMELQEERWPAEHAVAVAALYTGFNDEISCGVIDRNRGFAASLWTVGEALAQAATRARLHLPAALHPPVYANLSGRGGLLESDIRWSRLMPHASGVSFRTSAISLAADGSVGAMLVWAGTPKSGGSSSARGVVAFAASRADTSGLHALVAVGAGRYALPPLSGVRLAKVDAPGTWRLPWAADDTPMMSVPRYTVHVSWM